MGMCSKEYFRENALMHVQPVRTEENIPRSLRFAKYPNGQRRLQGAFFWSQEFQSGLIWRDIPEVCVDAAGQEIVD